MRQPYRISRAQLRDTFSELRRCGKGKRECQVLWLSKWESPEPISRVVHPRHGSTAISYELDESWLNELWADLAGNEVGVRVQIHTHPGLAFHSHTDDTWPLVQTPGFLSLVLPRFAMGEIGFEGAFLAEIAPSGNWREVDVDSRLMVTP